MVAKFSVTRRMTTDAEASAGLLSRMLSCATDLHAAGAKHGDDDTSVQRQKKAWGITQPITYPRMEDAIVLGRLGLRKLEAWIAEARAGHGEENLQLLVEALDFVSDSEHDFNTSTYASWLGGVMSQLSGLVERVQDSIRRREALVRNVERSSADVKARA